MHVCRTRGSAWGGIVYSACMYACMHACMYCMHVSVYVQVCTYTHVQYIIFLYIYTYVYTYTCEHASMHTCILHTYIFVCISMYVGAHPQTCAWHKHFKKNTYTRIDYVKTNIRLNIIIVWYPPKPYSNYWGPTL